ncbi:MAG: YkgJ family cysteine cluster protein [Planctomycetota bacterium]
MNLFLADVPGQRFDCRGCTNCCRDLVVHLTRLDREKIDRQNWARRIEGPAYVTLGRETVLNHRADGGCVFLTADGKCRIHAEHGAEAKPLACQLYPFTLEPGGGGVRVGIRFDCPTVARSEGTPLSSHRPALNALARSMGEQMPGQFATSSSTVALTASRPLSEQELDALVKRLDRVVVAEQVPLDARLASMCNLVETLRQARLDDVRDQRFTELLDLLMEESSSMVTDLPPADARQRKLLRQNVFAHMEHITLTQARASFISSLRYRWGQFQRSRLIANATDVAAARVDDVKPPLGDEAAESQRLLTRYLRARIACRSAFGSAYYGRPVLDGLCALLLAVATIGWLARYHAAKDGRDKFCFDDLMRAVGVVDRTAGRARELGAKSAQLRVTYLRNEDGLLRLLRAYPIMASERP